MSRQALGRGLGALIAQEEIPSKDGNSGLEIRKISVEKIRTNPFQPRSVFDPKGLDELAQSIRQNGLTQPIIVAGDPLTGDYELVAGERRLRAAKMAGLSEIEAVVRTPQDSQKKLTLSLVENIQRQDLNPIEEARAYRRFSEEFKLTQAQIAEMVGKSRPAVANTVRLLDLPAEIQQSLEGGEISEGHARVLLAVSDPVQRRLLWKKAAEKKLSVREVELLISALEGNGKGRIKASSKKLAEIREMEDRLRRHFGTKVEVRLNGRNKGNIKIHFASLDDFDRLLKILRLPA